jgi:NitT/TauT family transport system substrate-binding protein
MKILILLLFVGHSIISHAKIKVGSSPVVSSAGIYLALELGFFKEQGLEVEVNDVPNSGPPMTMLLSKGELDVGAGNLSAGLFNAILKKQNFKLVADKGHLEKGKSYIGLLVRADHLASGRYKTLKDLKGFKMGLTGLDGVSQQILAERFLKKAGLQPTDVEYVKLSYGEMNLALKTKAIDATIQLEPFLTKAVIEGFAKKVEDGTSVYPNQQSAAVFYSPDFMKRQDEAEKFMIAYLKGVRLYNQSLKDKKVKADVVNALRKHINLDDSLWEKMTPVGLKNDGRLNEKALMDDLSWYRQKGYVTGELRSADFVDNKFVRNAVK